MLSFLSHQDACWTARPIRHLHLWDLPFPELLSVSHCDHCDTGAVFLLRQAGHIGVLVKQVRRSRVSRAPPSRIFHLSQNGYGNDTWPGRREVSILFHWAEQPLYQSWFYRRHASWEKERLCWRKRKSIGCIANLCVKFFRCGQSIKLSSRRMFCIVHKNATRLLDLASPPIKLGGGQKM